MTSSLLGALLIFSLRVTDVSIGTIRTLQMVRGKIWIAAGLGLLESGIFITAITTVLSGASKDPVKMVGYALGFACGTLLGMAIERWIASGQVMIRVITRNHAIRLRAALINEGFGVTAVRGEGKDGEVIVLFVVAARRLNKRAIETIREIDPEAFITIEPVSKAIGGHFPMLNDPLSMKK